MHTISKDFTFSASHQLDGLSDDHPCSRLHGHNYTVRATITGEQNRVGFVVDYRDLEPFKNWLDGRFDHRHLNDTLPFNPTAENMAEYFARYLADLVACYPTVESVEVAVSETPKTWAKYRLAVGLDPLAGDEDRYRWGDNAHEAALRETRTQLYAVASTPGAAIGHHHALKNRRGDK